jgi:hypothetical protein
LHAILQDLSYHGLSRTPAQPLTPNTPCSIVPSQPQNRQKGCSCLPSLEIRSTYTVLVDAKQNNNTVYQGLFNS